MIDEDTAVYEIEGLRPGGRAFTFEILGYQTRADAASLARYYADLWKSAVRLYRVPFVNTGSTPWAEDEIEFLNKFTCEDTNSDP